MTGRELCRLRQAAGLSRLETAILLHVPRATVEGWEQAGLPDDAELEREVRAELTEWHRAFGKLRGSRVEIKPAEAWFAVERRMAASARGGAAMSPPAAADDSFLGGT